MKNLSKNSSRRSVSTRASFRSLLALGMTAGAGLLGMARLAQAADDIWVFSGDPANPTATNATTGGGTGNYDDGPTGYWSLGVKPTANANNAVINNGGTVNITANETPVDIILDDIVGGSGTFNQTAGTVTQSQGWFRLGTVANTTLPTQSNYNLSGGALTMTAGTAQQFNISEAAFTNDQVTISGTGAVTGGNFGTFNIGETAGGVGVLNVNAGGLFNFTPTATSNNANNTVTVGGSGTGTFNVAGGTVNFQPTVGGSYPFVIGRASNGSGTLNLSSGVFNLGTASNIQEMWIGNAGTGAISTTPTGTLNVSGGTLNVSSWLALGRNTTNNGGTGAMTITGGVVNGAINGGNISLAGTGTTSVGTTAVTGGSLNTPNAIYVTEGGQGTLSISGTGTVTEFSGTGLRLNTTAATNTVATGTLNLGNGTTTGGLLTVNNVNTVNTTAARSIFNFNGGTLQAIANNATFLGSATGTLGAGVANVRNLGAILDSNSTNITVTQALTHSGIAGDNATDGGLTKVGLGTLTLTGANTYTGNTTITTGAVDAQTAGSLPGLNTAGRINVGAAGALVVGVGYSAGQMVGDIDTARASNTFATGGSIGLDTATATTPYTYATNLTPAVTTDFYKLGAGTLSLTGTNTYTGITYLSGGLLTGNIGTGGLTFNGGGLQLNAASTANLNNRATIFNGTALIDTNGNNAVLASTITGLGGGSLTKAGTGDLTLTGGFNFSPTRAYTPAAQTLGNLFVTGGSLTLSGAAEVVNSGANYTSIGLTAGNFGTLNVINGATATTTGDFNVADVGGVAGATAAGIPNTNNGGVLNISGTGSAVTGNNVYVGKGGNATAATATTTSNNGSLAVGVINQTGGTFTGLANSQIGVYGQGQYNLSGGTFNHTGGYISVGRQTGSFGMLDVSGTGVVTDTAAGTRTIIGEAGTGVLNVRSGGVVNANTSTTNNSGNGLTSALAALTIGNAAGTTALPTLGVVNLLPGGTINTQSVGSVTGAAAGTVSSQFNFNGGRLANTVATATLMQNLTQANVFSGGAIIDTTAGNATVAQPLVAPAGNGVTGITGLVATSGTTFSTTPIVQITGGGGVGATAIATVDGSGNISGFTITNPGTGYTTTPTVTITGPSGTVYTGTTTLGANTSGGLTKVGANILTLTGANTYTGATTISAGTLALGAGGSIAQSTQIGVGTGTTFDVSAITFTAGAGQTIFGTGGTINAGANTFTLSGTLSPGATIAAGDTGTLSIASTGALTLTGTAVLQFDIVNPATKDLLSFTGAGATLNVNGTLALRGTITAGTTYTIASGLTAENGTFTTVTGVPANFVPAFTFTGGNYNVTFAVPEPSTWALGVFGLAGMATVWMRRRRVA